MAACLHGKSEKEICPQKYTKTHKIKVNKTEYDFLVQIHFLVEMVFWLV